MVSLARPRRVSASAAAAASAPSTAAAAAPLRGGFSLGADADGGFCVRGSLAGAHAAAAAAPSDAAAGAHDARQPRAVPFSALSRGLFARISAGPLFELAAKVAPATCVRLRGRCVRACGRIGTPPETLAASAFRATAAHARVAAQARAQGGGALQRRESARRRPLPLPLAGACVRATLFPAAALIVRRRANVSC
jgi:hypothetical protein